MGLAKNCIGSPDTEPLITVWLPPSLQVQFVKRPAEIKTESRVFSAQDARMLAKRRVPRLVYDFIEGGTGREVSARENEAAFDRIKLQARVLSTSSGRNLATDFLGQSFSGPIGVAPMGMCNLAWPGADAMIGRAAQHFGMPVCLSTAASSTIEEMRGWAGENAWFQLYVNGTTDAALQMAGRAGDAGYDTLILTVDVPEVSRRIRDIRNGFGMPFRIGFRQALDFALHPRWTLETRISGVPTPKNFAMANGSPAFDRHASRAGADWEFLSVLRKQWNGNLIVKGVTAPEDAIRIRDLGADAIWVSNHGGRQLDASLPAIQLLPKIRAALGDTCPVIFDSGVRQGEDVVRALALGADLVMLGRPILYAIAGDGEAGLNAYLRSILKEIDIAMAQIGVSTLNAIGPGNLAGKEPDETAIGPASLKLASSK